MGDEITTPPTFGLWKECFHCHKRISANAETCPKCHRFADDPKKQAQSKP